MNKLCALLLCLLTTLTFAQVKAEGAWARPTVKGQQAGGGFVAITSPGADRLIGASSAVSDRVELHTMSMKGDVMEMRRVEAIELPAGRKVELKPGSFHVMFMGLKQALAAGTKVPVTLKFEKAGELTVDFAVSAAPMDHEHGH
jgi:periplasmic copper chaperone A